jgi:hypothetical protein
MRILQSYRWRRRFAWIGVPLALIAVLVVAVILPPEGHGTQTDIEPTSTEPAQTEASLPKEVRVTKSDRRAVNRTLVAFVRTGVTRADPAAAWELVTPAMRSGVTRKEWNKGQLPVFPFPAQIPDEPFWNVLTAYPGDLTIDLLLQPRANRKTGAIAFSVELKKTRRGPWLVDSMVPEQAFAAPPSGKTPRQANAPNGAVLKGKLSPLWLIVPAVLLAPIALVPVLLLLNTWRRNRAFERRYRAERGL